MGIQRTTIMTYDILIVGAGITGCVLAERFASVGRKVLIIDKRDRIGGNCYDKLEKGVLIHKYGPHQFRTNSKKVKDYLSKFTEWMPYSVHNKALINGKYYTFPINRNTINEVFKTELKTKEQVKEFIDLLLPYYELKGDDSESYVINKMGYILYEMFYKYYTIKQWGLHPKELPASVCGRVPIYYDDSNAYVEGKERIMPQEGYTKMFGKMLTNPNITIKLNKIWKSDCDIDKVTLVIWTGRIDEFFDYKFGKLPYRSLKFTFTTYEKQYHQQCYKIAYPTMDVDQTRDIEIKYLTGQKCNNTVICREFPSSQGEPFYPINTFENRDLCWKYLKEAEKLKDVIFIGRLAEYKYLDMDECVENALNKFEELQKCGNTKEE